jgi:hypothetical protein
MLACTQSPLNQAWTAVDVRRHIDDSYPRLSEKGVDVVEHFGVWEEPAAVRLGTVHVAIAQCVDANARLLVRRKLETCDPPAANYAHFEVAIKGERHQRVPHGVLQSDAACRDCAVRYRLAVEVVEVRH